MPVCPAGRCENTSCFMYPTCKLRSIGSYAFAMIQIQKLLGFLLARHWSTWEIMEKVFPKSVLQQSQQREECLGDLLEALRQSGFIAVKGAENVLKWEWKPGYELRLKASRMDEDVIYLPRRRGDALPEWMQRHT